jgi:hypothetical protein
LQAHDAAPLTLGGLNKLDYMPATVHKNARISILAALLLMNSLSPFQAGLPLAHN